MKEPQISVLIADDHPIVRKGLRAVLEPDRRIRALHEAEDGGAALELIHAVRPEVAVLDIEMPVMDGFQVATAVLGEGLDVHLVILTMHSDEQALNRAMDLGIQGFVLKENAVAEILSAILAVSSGSHYFSPALSGHMIRRGSGKAGSPTGLPDLGTLTPAEERILRLIAENKTTTAIAEELFISPKTVEKHRSNICSKLNLRGAYALLRFALTNRSRL